MRFTRQHKMQFNLSNALVTCSYNKYELWLLPPITNMNCNWPILTRCRNFLKHFARTLSSITSRQGGCLPKVRQIGATTRISWVNQPANKNLLARSAFTTALTFPWRRIGFYKLEECDWRTQWDQQTAFFKQKGIGVFYIIYVKGYYIILYTYS